MAKVICLFALAVMASGAPKPNSSLDQEGLISNILSSIQPSIELAVSQALGESRVETFVPFTQNAETFMNNNYNENAFSSEENNAETDLATYKAVSQGNVFSLSGGKVQHEVVKQESYLQEIPLQPFLTCGTQLDNYDSNLTKDVEVSTNQQIAEGITHDNNFDKEHSNQENTQGVGYQGEIILETTDHNVNYKTPGTSVDRDVVESVLAALIPSINAAVQASIQNSDRNAVVTSSSSTNRKQASEVSSVEIEPVQYRTPVITTYLDNIKENSIISSSAGMNYQATAQSSSLSSSNLIAQIIAALNPTIQHSVQELVGKSQTNSVPVLTYQVEQIITPAKESFVNTEFNTQSIVSNLNTGSSGTKTASSLNNIFGDGKSNSVRVETPAYKIQYSN